ncbi:MAG: TfoX/Sxy family protein [Polyangiaceae bacterium]
MAWVKVPPENHAPFVAALPKDPRVEVAKMFGGLAAKVNGHLFAGLFGLSAMVLLDDASKAEALALPGAGPFDPMGDGRAMSEKVMLPPALMRDPSGLAAWLRRAYDHALALPTKAPKVKRAAATLAETPSAKRRTAKPAPPSSPSRRRSRAK